MTDWKKYRGSGPWDFEPTVGKLKYNEGNLIRDYTNPVWSLDRTGVPITPTHTPCGYWWGETIIPSEGHRRYVYLTNEVLTDMNRTASSIGYVYTSMWIVDENLVLLDKGESRFYIHDLSGNLLYFRNISGIDLHSASMDQSSSDLTIYARSGSDCVSIDLQSGIKTTHGAFFSLLSVGYWGTSGGIGYSSYYGRVVWIVQDLQSRDISVYPFSLGEINLDDCVPLDNYSCNWPMGQIMVYDDYFMGFSTSGPNHDWYSVGVFSFASLPEYEWGWDETTSGNSNGYMGGGTILSGDVVRYAWGLTYEPFNADYDGGILVHDVDFFYGLHLGFKTVETYSGGPNAWEQYIINIS